ncbi:MAG TPA: hypothetical protein VI363_06915 [Burkholderiales bacterium]
MPELRFATARAERSLLREVLIVEQKDPALKRRWFESDYFDLFIWQNLDGAFVRFQLCYDVELNERALIWNGSDGFYHDGVDHGERDGRMQAPIFVRDGKFDSGAVVPRFEQESVEMPAEVRDFVLARMREHLIELHRQKLGRKRVRRERWQQRKVRSRLLSRN